MTTAALLAIALGAVALLLILVINVELPAFVALMLVSMGTALVAGIPLVDVVPTMVAGMGKTLGGVAIVVGLGSMLGKLIEESGGADSLARTFTEKLGRKRVIAAITIASFILGIPVFFDVGFIILAPIIFGFAKITNIHPLKIGMPVGAVMLTVHVAVPPHPGPVAAAGLTGADIGWMTILGIGISAVVGVVGFYAARMFNIEGIKLGQSPATAAIEGKSVLDQRPASKIPGATTVVSLILFPIALIMIGSVMQTVLGKEHSSYAIASFIGSPTTALLLGLVLAYFVVGRKATWKKKEVSSITDSALPAVAIIIFVTGAGGVFGNVLVESGIGKALQASLSELGVPVILLGWIIAAALRAAQGSATVAILTAGGLVQGVIEAGSYSQIQIVLITLAVAFGGLGFSHINDSGFWIVTKYLGLSIADGLKTWTVLTSICGVTGLLVTWGVYLLV